MAKKFKPNKGQQDVLDALAHCMIAQNFDQHVKGGAGFFKFYLEQPGNKEMKEIWEAFGGACKKARKDLLEMFEKDRVAKEAAGG